MDIYRAQGSVDELLAAVASASDLEHALDSALSYLDTITIPPGDRRYIHIRDLAQRALAYAQQEKFPHHIQFVLAVLD